MPNTISSYLAFQKAPDVDLCPVEAKIKSFQHLPLWIKKGSIASNLTGDLTINF